MKKLNNIDYLISKVISENATDEEVLQLNDWVDNNKSNQCVYWDRLKIWQAAKTWLPKENIKQDKLKIVTKVNQNLILKSRKSRQRSLIYMVAAILAFPISIAISILVVTNFSSRNIAPTICEIYAPIGHISKCILPDKTEVWINSGSKIAYDANNFNDGIREVTLDGEAYFDVAKNKIKPFYVRSFLASIKVTGTSFNVKAFSNSKTFETVLSEGNIELEFSGVHTGQYLKVKPGERVVFDLNKDKLFVHNVDTRIYSSWRNGQLIFQDATLRDLIKELERIYNVQFRFDNPNLGNYRFRGTFSYDNNLISALEKFKITANIDYRIENNEVILSENIK